MLRTALHVVILLWWTSEIALAVRTRNRRVGGAKPSSGVAVLWLIISVGTSAALAAQASGAPRLPLSGGRIVPIALALIIGGLVIRWWAILTLGRLFSVDVVLQDRHTLVRRGIYGVIRHPSYTGMLLSFLGFGIALGNWLSLALAVVPVTLAFLHRIRVEEALLLRHFRAEYEEYRAKTKRLIPWIY